MDFHKYHGIGNDFVMLTDYSGRLGPPGSLAPEFVRAICDRRTGVGGDGVIRIVGPEGDPETARAGALLRMDYYNADGGVAEMCGNGVRCLARLARRSGRLGEGEQPILTGAGVATVRLEADGRVTVDMGAPGLEREDVPMNGEGSAGRVSLSLDGGPTVEGTGVSMGNPHFVLFLDELAEPSSEGLVTTLGPRLEIHPAFPHRVNVEFVEVTSAEALRMRVWERGVGETLACGTGACAAAVAAASLGRTGRRVTVSLAGGDLEVDWAADGRVWMTGPAEEVFAGRLSEGWVADRGLGGLVGHTLDDQKEAM